MWSHNCNEFWPLGQFWESCVPDREIVNLLVIDIVGTFLVAQQNRDGRLGTTCHDVPFPLWRWEHVRLHTACKMVTEMVQFMKTKHWSPNTRHETTCLYDLGLHCCQTVGCSTAVWKWLVLISLNMRRNCENPHPSLSWPCLLEAGCCIQPFLWGGLVLTNNTYLNCVPSVWWCWLPLCTLLRISVFIPRGDRDLKCHQVSDCCIVVGFCFLLIFVNNKRSSYLKISCVNRCLREKARSACF